VKNRRGRNEPAAQIAASTAASAIALLPLYPKNHWAAANRLRGQPALAGGFDTKRRKTGH